MTNVISSDSAPLEEKRKVRPFYNELFGYLSSAPKDENQVFYESEPQLNQVNEAINLLNSATGKNYDRFKLSYITGSGGSKFIRITAYKQKLSGLISYLHGEFFYDEQPPFSGAPSTIITQSQSQQQSFNVVILELQRKISEKIANTHDEKEKGFLRKFESILPSITNGVQLVKSVFDLCVQMGLDPNQIIKLFS